MEKDMIELIKRTVAKGATDDELLMFMHYCKAAGVDPLRKQAHFIVTEWENKYTGKMERNTNMMIGIDGFQARATKDPKYLGIHAHAVREKDVFEFDVITGGVVHKITSAVRGKIVGAYAVLQREGMPNACEWVSFDEYNTGKATWAKIPEVMITKVARAALLRREYPDSFSGVYAPEEFGAEITDGGEYIPLPKSEPVKQLIERASEPIPIQDCPEPIIDTDVKPKPTRKPRNSPKTQSSPENVADVPPKDESPKNLMFKPDIIRDTPYATFEAIQVRALELEIGHLVKPIINDVYPQFYDNEMEPADVPDADLIRIIERLTGVRMEDWECAEKMRQEMMLVIDNAIHKAIARSNKPGNTWEPWKDFTAEHLEVRLKEEITEYFEEHHARELVDVINISVFLFLRKTIYLDTAKPTPEAD